MTVLAARAAAPWALGERLTPRVRVALALGVVGTALLVLAPHGALDLTARLGAGALLALAAGLAYALYVVLAKATLARMAPLRLTALTFTVGAVLLTPAVLSSEAPLRQLALGWPWLLDRVARRIVEKDLLSAETRDDIVAKAGSRLTQSLDLTGEILDLESDAVPATWLRFAPIWHGLSGPSSTGRRAQQEP